jgi:hypothetical protein
VCYDLIRMRRLSRTAFAVFLAVVCGPVLNSAEADPREALARARALYNQRQYAAAIEAADEGRAAPEQVDSADLIAARAYLERFRESAATEDLSAARERLRRLDPQRLLARERSEFVIGLGEALFFDGAAGAAADIFESVLEGFEIGPEARERVLDWWASALDRDVRPRSDFDRQAVYSKIRDRMRLEVAARPTSAVSAYWMAAAAAGQGDWRSAWDAAQAGWVRASLADDYGVSLRADLDRLVARAIAPERAKMLGQPPEILLSEWEQFKERWKR